MTSTEPELVSVVYHECFHVYQKNHFKPSKVDDFFQAIAAYPEMNPRFRAYSRAQVGVLSNHNISAEVAGCQLNKLARRRYDLLAHHPGTLPFEKMMERMEGTAYYVGQRVLSERYSQPPHPLTYTSGPFHMYLTGEAVCRLLDITCGGWQKHVEGGESLSEILMRCFGTVECTLDDLHLPIMIATETQAVAEIRARLLERVQGLEAANPMRVSLPAGISIRRSFNPMKIAPLGDGRLIHDDFLILQIPSGTIHLKGGGIIEDTIRHEVCFPSAPLECREGTLAANCPTAEISVKNAVQTGENLFIIEK
jgi:hypothetical protein